MDKLFLGEEVSPAVCFGLCPWSCSAASFPGRWGALVLPALFLPQLFCLPHPRSAGWRDGVERVPPGSVPWAAGVHCAAVTTAELLWSDQGEVTPQLHPSTCPEFPVWLLWQGCSCVQLRRGCSYPCLCLRLFIPKSVHMQAASEKAQLYLQSR